MAVSKKQYLEMLRSAEETLPLKLLVRCPKIDVEIDEETDQVGLGRTKGNRIVLNRRTLQSRGLFYYSLLHEIGHVVFSNLKPEYRQNFLQAIGVTPARWKTQVLRSVTSEDQILKRASMLEVRRIHEDFAEAYAEYWTKREYLLARSEKLHAVMRTLFFRGGVDASQGLGEAALPGSKRKQTLHLQVVRENQ